tara:strand:+ start:235 stop:447 length:213 start_codon:yes stop_codon:yes gene_type:complete
MNKEGNIISFKVFINSKGLLMTEYSKVEAKDLSKIFNSEDLSYLTKILSKVDFQFKNLHRELEQELEALK